MNNTILWIIVVIAMLLVGILIIPRLTRKATGKLYKKKSTHIKMDLNHLGPELVKKSELGEKPHQK